MHGEMKGEMKFIAQNKCEKERETIQEAFRMGSLKRAEMKLGRNERGKRKENVLILEFL